MMSKPKESGARKPRPKKSAAEKLQLKKPMESSRYQYLLDDPDVMRQLMNECRGSEITGRERLRRLGAICERFDTTPEAGQDDSQGGKELPP